MCHGHDDIPIGPFDLNPSTGEPSEFISDPYFGFQITGFGILFRQIEARERTGRILIQIRTDVDTGFVGLELTALSKRSGNVSVGPGGFLVALPTRR